MTALYTRYRFNIFQEYQETESAENYYHSIFYGNQYRSGIEDLGIRVDFDYSPIPAHLIRFGGSAVRHKFSPGVAVVNSSNLIETTAGAETVKATELDAFIEDEWKINRAISLNLGIHSAAFYVNERWYSSWQPRLAGRLLMNNDYAIKASYSTMMQFVHLLTNAGLGLPTDLWVPTTARIRPQYAQQVALGVAKVYRQKYEFSVETFYKTMSHLIDYKDGSSYLDTGTDWQDKVVTDGTGKSYGIELLAQKREGKLTGWIGYTLSKTTRQFAELNFGKEFPYKFDRRHDASVVVAYGMKKNRELSMTFVYGTGNAITIPKIYYQYATNINLPQSKFNAVTYYGDRNSYRMDAYHRLDIAYSWWKNKNNTQRKWTVGVYNVYNHLNPYYINTRIVNQRNVFIQHSLFPIVPSVTYTIKWL